MPVRETTLALLPASVPNERVVVVLVSGKGRTSRMELRQQTFGAGIGWFTQQSIPLEPRQWATLRGALGNGAVPCTTAACDAACRAGEGSRLRLVHAESA